MNEQNEDRETASRLVNKLLESVGKAGVYYLLRFPTRWRLYSFPWDEFGDLWHRQVWQRYAIEDLAEVWAPKTDVPAPVMIEKLKLFWKGFPRGRVERLGPLEYTIFHGDDFADTGITKHGIETAFELGNCRVNWSFDPHETQNPEHSLVLRELLKI